MLMRPQIYAHRGVSRQRRENSVDAFLLAVEMGVDGVELDVRKTLNGQLVVHHDSQVDGVLIADAERKNLPSYVPDLNDALNACRGLRVNIEIKADGTDKAEVSELAKEVARHLGSRAEPMSQWLVSSFDHSIIDQVHEFSPNLPTALIFWRKSPQDVVGRTANNGHLAIHPHESMVDKELITAAHAAGVEVNTWTVNDLERAVELAELGVDGLITDLPDRVLEVLDR